MNPTTTSSEILSEKATVTYLPKSKATFRMETEIPRNMAFEIQKALTQLVLKHGNIDNYVRDQLKYSSLDALWKSFAAEQVDAIGLYLSQFEKEQAVIIADQTGIGKGRQAAAVIRHAILHDYIPVFFTRNASLFTDLYRDLKNIDFEKISPLILNTDSSAKIKAVSGEVMFSPLKSEEQKQLLAKEYEVPTDSEAATKWLKSVGKPYPNPEEHPTITINEVENSLPEEYNMVLTTYSQVQSAAPFKKLWLSNLIEAGIEGSKKKKKVVFILDESHMAGGYDTIIGTWMREVLPKTKACCYLSATFAKYPEVMPFYAQKTAIQETKLRDSHLVDNMSNGGLALQEIIASNLAESGQLIRRQRSNEGIKVDYLTLDHEPTRTEHREKVNRMVTIMQDIVRFEREHIHPLLQELNEQAKESAAHLKKKPAGLGVKQSPYFSKVFNVIDQMIFALKVEEVAKLTLKLLGENKKVVIAFKSTMGSFLKDLKVTTGDILSASQVDFMKTFRKGLDGLFNYSYVDASGEKTRKKVSHEMLSYSGQLEYDELVQRMELEEVGLSISPIDQLISIIENTAKPTEIGGHLGKNYTVTEVTGRNQRLRYEDGEYIVNSFKSDTTKSFREFNAGTYDVLLINQSGSTGSSAHASIEFADQRQRAMVIHQFELDINTEVQKRGRINRTGQVVPPEYYYVTTSIPTEKRLMTMLKAKLKSLDANTTGSQKTNDEMLDSPDFFNKYGDEVAFKWVTENPYKAEELGDPTYVNRWGEVERSDGVDAMKQVTGRLGLLPVEEQEEIFNELLEKYHAHINWLKQQGDYDLETEFLPLSAEVKNRFLFQSGQGGTSPFGQDTLSEETIVNNLRKPYTKEELDKIVVKILDGKTPLQHHEAIERLVSKTYPQITLDFEESTIEYIQKDEKKIEQLQQQRKEIEDDENKLNKNELKIEAIEAKIESRRATLQQNITKISRVKENLLQLIQRWKVGDVVKISSGEYEAWGMFLEVKIGSAKNIFSPGNITVHFAVSDYRKRISFNFTDDQVIFINNIAFLSQEIDKEKSIEIKAKWNELVKLSSKNRETRYFLTGNIVGVSSFLNQSNKLVKYDTVAGEVKNGIFMNREYDQQNKKALVSMLKAYKNLLQLAKTEIVADAEARVRFSFEEEYVLKVYITKSGNKDLYVDTQLRGYLQRPSQQDDDQPTDFIQQANDMVGYLHHDKVELFLKRLDDFGLKYLGESHPIDEKKLAKQNEANWSKRTAKEAHHTYALGKKYGHGSNPDTGFVTYQEPTERYPKGTVTFSRKLTDKEKFSYSLIPVFQQIEEPYEDWQNFISQSNALQNEFEDTLQEAQTLPLSEAILTIGYFIANNAHETGNHEYVFGHYSPAALGKHAYEIHVKPLEPLDEVLSQLQIAIGS